MIKSTEKVDRLGYNGEVEDSYNLQYLIARYYKQDSSRFISEDTYRGQVGSPLLHHLYTFTEKIVKTELTMKRVMLIVGA